jgi:hypothetical protein
MKTIQYSLLTLFLSWMFSVADTIAQQKFEFGVSIEPLVVPVNFGTYVEKGQGFYDINGRGKITQSASAYFTYWPITSFGISLGATFRNFRSQIDYEIPDPFYENLEPVLEGSYPFTAKGLGPSLSVLFRKDKWRASIGLSAIDLFAQEYISNSSISEVAWITGGEVIAELEVEENAYWHTIPSAYALLQFEGQYTIFDNVYIKCSFETTVSGQYPYPYTLFISGFTPEAPPQSQVLNDYAMKNTLTSFSFGVGYVLGFGKYNRDRSEDSQ